MFLRSGKSINSVSDIMPNSENQGIAQAEAPVVQQIIITPEMLQGLIQGIQNMQTSNTASNVSSTSNFASCKSRFDGSVDADVEAFIDAITVYKDCLTISDNHAVKGMSMLLTDSAATWWQGIKASVNTFEEALDALRHAYGFSKPPYQIYIELFSQSQDNQKTNLFISRVRSLFSRLTGESALSEHIQLDITYGLLNPKIRDRVPRDKVCTFKELIEQARLAEQALNDFNTMSGITSKASSALTNTNISQRKSKQCSYCKNFGHVKEECRKLSSRTCINKETKPLTISNANDDTSAESPTRDVSPRTDKKQLACYGCNTPGYIRSNCPKCSTFAYASTSDSTEDSVIESSNFLYNTVLLQNARLHPEFTPAIRPLAKINVLGHNGYCFLDSGAQTSIAGSMLRDILLEEGTPCVMKPMNMTLADGKTVQVEALHFDIQIKLQNRVHNVSMIAVAEHSNSRTLLGADFIKAANIVIDIPNNSWFYGDNPHKPYHFVDDFNNHNLSVNSVSMHNIKLRDDEGSYLSVQEKENLNELLEDNIDVFSPSGEVTPFAEHGIILTDPTPIAVPPYRLPESKKAILKLELDNLLKDGTIEPCESPYAAPVVLVPKKDGSTRLTVDYRKLNAVTRADCYPLPRIDDILHMAKKTKYMTTLDLKSGYHQVAVKMEDRDKTAFVCPFGTYRFRKMPFGLRCAPATFQRLIDRFRAGLQDINLLAYLDDLIVLSPTYSEHIRDLQQVFNRLRLFKLHLNRVKCTFSCSSVRYLGHVITSEGIQADPAKVTVIANWPPPKNVKQLCSFIQTCSWFRRFIRNFSDVCKPLSSLLKKKVPWSWGPAQMKAFERLKILLVSSPILRQADTSIPFIIRTDASSYAIGACLLQGETSTEGPIEYASRLLTPAEINYGTTEKEALALVWAVTKFRGYIEGSTTIVQTDHQPLKWLMSLKAPSGRLARWSLLLQAYDLRIEYTPGRLNVVADMLSRPPRDDLGEEVISNLVSVDLPSETAGNLRREQLEDDALSKIINAFESEDQTDLEYKRWAERGYFMNNGILYRYVPDIDDESAQLVIPKTRIPRILEEYHDNALAGHYGVDRTFQRIASRFYWTGMRRTISDHISKCVDCQRFKASNLKPAGQLQTPVQAQRFEVLSIDLFGPLPETKDGYKWIFIVEDTCSRWIELFPLVQASAENCARCLIDEVVLRYGVPRRVISDNGVQFVSAVMQQVAHCLGFRQNLTPFYHPAANPVERKNRDLKVQLSILTKQDHTTWKERLPAIRFAMNTVRSKSTGYSAAFLTFGRELRSPGDVHIDLRAIIDRDNFIPQITPYLRTLSDTLRFARDTHEKEQDRVKLYADKSRRDVPPYKVGDHVFVSVHALSKAKDSYTAKLAPKRDGPYQIVRVISPTSYEVSSLEEPNEVLGKYHVSALTPYLYTSDDATPIRPLRKRGRPVKVHHLPENQPETSTSDLADEARDAPVEDTPSDASADVPEDVIVTPTCTTPVVCAIPDASSSPETPVHDSRTRPKRLSIKPQCLCCRTKKQQSLSL